MDKGNVDEVNYFDFCNDIDAPEQIFGVGRGYNHSFNYYPKTQPRITGIDIKKDVPDDVEDIIARRSTGRPMPVLGSAAVWLVELSGPAFTIEAEAILSTGGRSLLRAQVAQRGLSFRGGLMQYDILSMDVVR